MNIRSINDVITNSSDEVLIIKSNVDPEDLLTKLKEVLGPDIDHFSGMGGILETANSETLYERLEYPGGLEWLPEGYVVVDLDQDYCKKLVPYLEEHYEVIKDQEALEKQVCIGNLERAIAEEEDPEKIKELEEALRSYKEYYGE